MNKHNAHLYLPLVQALTEGKTVQLKPPGSRIWGDAEELEFSYDPDRYRVKPEPVELAIWYNPTPPPHWPKAIPEKEGSDPLEQHGYRKIKMREVLQ